MKISVEFGGCFFGSETGLHTRYVHIFKTRDELKEWESGNPYRQELEKRHALWLLEDYQQHTNYPVEIGKEHPTKKYISSSGHTYPMNLDEFLGSAKNDFIDRLNKIDAQSASLFDIAVSQSIGESVRKGKAEIPIIHFRLNPELYVAVANDVGTYCYARGSMSDYSQFMVSTFNLMKDCLYSCEETRDKATEYLGKYIASHASLFNFILRNNPREALFDFISGNDPMDKIQINERKFMESFFNSNLIEALALEVKHSKDADSSLVMLNSWLNLYSNGFPLKQAKILKEFPDKVIETSECLLSEIGSSFDSIDKILVTANHSIIRFYCLDPFKSKEDEKDFFNKASPKLLSSWLEAPIESSLKNSIKEVLGMKSLANVELGLLSEKEETLKKNKLPKNKLRI